MARIVRAVFRELKSPHGSAPHLRKYESQTAEIPAGDPPAEIVLMADRLRLVGGTHMGRDQVRPRSSPRAPRDCRRRLNLHC